MKKSGIMKVLIILVLSSALCFSVFTACGKTEEKVPPDGGGQNAVVAGEAEAKAFIALVNALPSVDNVTVSDETKITEAETAFAALGSDSLAIDGVLDAKAKLDDLKTEIIRLKADASALAEQKTAQKNRIEAKVGSYTESDYRPANWTEIVRLRDDAIDRIEACATLDALARLDVDALLSDIEAEAVKTDAYLSAVTSIAVTGLPAVPYAVAGLPYSPNGIEVSAVKRDGTSESLSDGEFTISPATVPACAVGTYELDVTYTANNSLTTKFAVTVLTPADSRGVNYTDIDLSENETSYNIENSVDTEPIVSAFVTKNDALVKTLGCKSGKIAPVLKSEISSLGGEYDLTVIKGEGNSYSASVYTLTVATKIIKTADDWNSLSPADIRNKENVCLLLGADIDVNPDKIGTAALNTLGENTTGNMFDGTLDGRGYKIDNLFFENTSKSLITGLNEKGVVKNLALTNVRLSDDQNKYYTNSILVRDSYGTVKDIYISVAEKQKYNTTSEGSGLIIKSVHKGNVSNVVLSAETLMVRHSTLGNAAEYAIAFDAVNADAAIDNVKVYCKQIYKYSENPATAEPVSSTAVYKIARADNGATVTHSSVIRDLSGLTSSDFSAFGSVWSIPQSGALPAPKNQTLTSIQVTDRGSGVGYIGYGYDTTDMIITATFASGRKRALWRSEFALSPETLSSQTTSVTVCSVFDPSVTATVDNVTVKAPSRIDIDLSVSAADSAAENCELLELASDGYSFVKAEISADGAEITQSGGKLYISKTVLSGMLGEYALKVTGTKNGKSVTDIYIVTAATKVIKQVSDWPTGATAEICNGYYVLGADIEVNPNNSGTKYLNQLGSNTVEFTGVFDGRGHSIIRNYVKSGASYFGGLFGTIGANATVKNLAYTEVLSYYPIGTFAWDISGTVENVYISLARADFHTDNTYLIARSVKSSAKLSRIVIDIESAKPFASSLDSKLGAGNSVNIIFGSADADALDNVFAYFGKLYLSNGTTEAGATVNFYGNYSSADGATFIRDKAELNKSQFDGWDGDIWNLPSENGEFPTLKSQNAGA